MKTNEQTLTDEEIIALCDRAGVRWTAPDEESEFPGLFDMASMGQMRAVIAQVRARLPAASESQAAIATLARLGYTYHGGELWKPPLGKPAASESGAVLDDTYRMAQDDRATFPAWTVRKLWELKEHYRLLAAPSDAPAPVEAGAPRFDMVAHLARQREWSERTFGPGARAKGVVDHIRKELCEIEADPGDLKEWVDVVILALDGAWRSGASPAQIVEAIVAKQTKNEGRQWPDWRTADPDKAIEHDRSADAAPSDAPAHQEWCSKCGCGSDQHGYAHLPHCSAAPAARGDEREAGTRGDFDDFAMDCGGRLACDGTFTFRAAAWHKFRDALSRQPSAGDAEPTTRETARERISEMLMQCADTMALYPDIQADPRAWEHLMVYMPQGFERAELSEAECAEFRTRHDTLSGMMNAAYELGWRRQMGAANQYWGTYYARKYDEADAARAQRAEEQGDDHGTR
jgi:hypothetical protein